MTFNECTTSSRREVQDKNLIAVEEHTSKRFVRKIIRSIDKSEKTLTKHLNLAITKSISNGRHQTLRNIQTCCHARICAMLYEKKDPVHPLSLSRERTILELPREQTLVRTQNITRFALLATLRQIIAYSKH